MQSRNRWWPTLTLALLVCCFTAVHASQVRPVNLEEMTRRAATIFAGRCVEVTVVSDPDLGRPVTMATFEVDRLVKGDPGETVSIRLLGGTPPGGAARTEVPGLPRFRAGEEVVLFLYGESRLGLSSPVGMGQGKFSVFEDKLGRTLAVNRFGNRNLFAKLSPAARARLGTVVAEWSEDETALSADTLLDLVESLEQVSGSNPAQPRCDGGGGS